MRFGNADPKANSDFKADVRSLSISIDLTRSGNAALLDANIGRQDFSLQNTTTLPINDSPAFLAIIKLLTASNPLAGLWSLPFNDKLRVMRTGVLLHKQVHQKIRPYQKLRYWSNVPFRHGRDDVVKQSATPSPDNPAHPLQRGNPNGLQDELSRHLASDSRMSSFDFGLQFLDAERMTYWGKRQDADFWIENASVEWNEAESPFHTVARLTLLSKSRLQAQASDAVYFDVTGHSTPDSTPLGSINRARWPAEVASRKARMHKEPQFPEYGSVLDDPEEVRSALFVHEIVRCTAGKAGTQAMRLVLALLLLLALPSQVPFAAEANAPPPGMTQQQFDALVDAISQAVVTKLRKQGAVVAAKPEAAARAAASEPEEDLESRVAIFEARAGQVLTSYPALVRELARIPAALDEFGSGGRGLWRFLLMLVIASCATIGAEIVVRRALDGVRRRMEGRLAAHEGWRAILPLTGLMATDAIALAAVGLVGYGLLGAWFAGSDNQGKLAGAVLRGIFAWRLYMLAFRIVLRPDLKGARLAAMDDVGAVAVYDRFSTIVLVGVLLRGVLLPIVVALQSPSEAIAAGQILGNVVVIGLFVWGAWVSREPMASWLADLARVDGRRSMGEFLGRHWLAVALPFFLLLLIAQIYGAIEIRSTIPAAMVLTLNVVIGLIFLKTLIAYLTRLHRHAAFSATEQEGPVTSAIAEPDASDVIARCVFVAAMLGAIALVAETWIVNVLALVNADGWRALTRASLTAAFTLFAAYVAWEFVKFATFRYGAQPAPGSGGCAGRGEPARGRQRLPACNANAAHAHRARHHDLCDRRADRVVRARREHHAADRRRVGVRPGDLLRQPDAGARYRIGRLLPRRRCFPGGRLH